MKVAALAQPGDLLPTLGGRFILTALDRIHHDAFLQCHSQGIRVLDVILIVHVRRRVTDQEHNPVGVLILAPGHAVHGIIQGLVDALRAIAATVSLKIHQSGVHGVQVGGQVQNLGDISITAIPVADQPHPDFWC